MNVSKIVSSEDDLDAANIVERLVPSYYTVQLLSNDWYLERVGDSGWERVEQAVLLSEKPGEGPGCQYWPPFPGFPPFPCSQQDSGVEVDGGGGWDGGAERDAGSPVDPGSLVDAG